MTNAIIYTPSQGRVVYVKFNDFLNTSLQFKDYKLTKKLIYSLKIQLHKDRLR